MPVTHINRKDQTYYLHQATTKTGKPRYYFSTKSDGNLPEYIPEGFEIYENPHAQVFLRRILPQIITEEEVATVQRAMQQYSNLEHYRIDVKKSIITVFVANQDVDELVKALSVVRPGQEASLRRLLVQSITYSPELRFVLEDRETRVFITERYCYLGSIDDWIEIGNAGKLETLAKRYVRHLGKDSFSALF